MCESTVSPFLTIMFLWCFHISNSFYTFFAVLEHLNHTICLEFAAKSNGVFLSFFCWVPFGDEIQMGNRLTIEGVKGSCAEKYAACHNLLFRDFIIKKR